MSRKYNRISSDDRDERTVDREEKPEQIKSPSMSSVISSASTGPQTQSFGRRLSDKIYALMWVLIALFTAKQTDTVSTVLSSPKPIRPVLHIAITQMVMNFILMLYLGIFLPKVKGLKSSEAWNVYCPRVIPFMTVNGLVLAFTLTRSLWPVYGFWTPFILGIEFMGLLFSSNFIPCF